ncbi:MAG: PhnD/SsuA/transferrin family substrate-binding protein [Acidimicrobiales bacterium]|nr:PhnD/SsuA/transferrin family substrate-binding protein [Acidimicrobiales bacterium]
MQFVSYMSPGFPESLFEVLAREMGAELHFETETSGPAPGTDPFRDGTFDLGWICSTSFVDLALHRAEPSVRIAGVAWVPDDPDAHGRPVYFGDVVVRPDAPFTSVADLAGLRIGCNDVVSLSGHYALRFAIEDLGAHPDDFAELVFTGGHHHSLDALVRGEIDACVVDSVVRIGRSRHDAAVAGLRVIDRLGPWPVQPLVARHDFDDAELHRLRTALLAANDRPEVRAELERAALTTLVEVGVDHYTDLHAAMERGTGSIS